MRCLQRLENDPYFNIAAEEYLLMNAHVDTFMLWRNTSSVIIGKHQNANREINHKLLSELDIPVVRRITGGGTVYHDPGNINFSFIRLNRKENPVDFKFFTRPIIIFLQSMGLDAEFEGKSNIVVNGLKVSGNSAHVYRGRVLHHGTLLFNADLDILNKILATDEERYQDRSVRSLRRKVSNISSLIQAHMGVEDFMESLFSFMINYYDDAYHDRLSAEENDTIHRLAREKYIDVKWNFGYSPDYQFSTSWTFHGGRYEIHLSTREAIIESIKISGPSEKAGLLAELGKHLTGVLHEKNSVKRELKKFNFASGEESRLVPIILDKLF